MKGIDRREFLKLAGAGSVAVAAGAVVPAAAMLASRNGAFTFRAVAGLPREPFPSYASYVVQGHVDLTSHSGMVTQTTYAGDPKAMSTIALPGLTRTVRITGMRGVGATLELSGVIDDKSQLRRGESSTVTIGIDRSRGVVRAPFPGSNTPLELELTSQP